MDVRKYSEDRLGEVKFDHLPGYPIGGYQALLAAYCEISGWGGSVSDVYV